MKFLVLILVLGLRRLEVSWPQWLTLRSRHQTWLQSLGNRLGNGPLLYLLAVLLPAVLLALLGCALQGFWAQWLWLLMALLVLARLVGFCLAQWVGFCHLHRQAHHRAWPNHRQWWDWLCYGG